MTARHHRLALVGVALAGVASLGACSVVSPSAAAPAGTAAAGSSSSSSSSSTTTAATAPVSLTPNVAAGATGVALDTVVKVTAAQGTVSAVTMSYKDPKKNTTVPVQGTLDPAGASWTATGLLEPNATYDLTMTGQNKDGKPTTTTSSFSTLKVNVKSQLIYPTIVGDGATVGTAMPVIVRFDVPVTDRASIQKHLKVTSTPNQPGTWSWVSNNEVHYRPPAFWQAGTKVKVDVDINSVPAGNGTYGQMDVSGGFTVGRSLVMKADLSTHQMQVVINGQVARTIPVTGGKAGFSTRSGTKVIMEKFTQLRMDANTVGIEPGDPNYYNIPDVKYAMRETNSGEFLHAAPWSVASQGVANVSHGCIGMSTANAGWLFGQVMVGDPVVVTGTARTLEPGNGWTDWNIPYAQFAKGSAL